MYYSLLLAVQVRTTHVHVHHMCVTVRSELRVFMCACVLCTWPASTGRLTAWRGKGCPTRTQVSPGQGMVVSQLVPHRAGEGGEGLGGKASDVTAAPSPLAEWVRLAHHLGCPLLSLSGPGGATLHQTSLPRGRALGRRNEGRGVKPWRESPRS